MPEFGCAVVFKEAPQTQPDGQGEVAPTVFATRSPVFYYPFKNGDEFPMIFDAANAGLLN